MYSTGNHVRRTQAPKSNAPPYSDTRFTSSNPQPIPQNAPLGPMQRSANTPTNRYAAYSPAQSPQQHTQYLASPSMYATHGTPTEMSAPTGMPPSTTKPNGQFNNNIWPTQQRMQYSHQHSQPSHSQAAVYSNTPPITKYSQQVPSTYSTYQPNSSGMMPGNNPPPFLGAYMPQPQMRPRYPTPNTSSNMTPLHPMQATAASYFPASPQYYPPMQQYPGYDTMNYPHNTQPQIHNPSMMPPQTIPAPSQPRKKVITIKDPFTMQDVTKDILQAGRQQDSVSPLAQSVVSNIATGPQDQIAAQFAAKVAAAATEGSEKPEASNATNTTENDEVTNPSQQGEIPSTQAVVESVPEKSKPDSEHEPVLEPNPNRESSETETNDAAVDVPLQSPAADEEKTETEQPTESPVSQPIPAAEPVDVAGKPVENNVESNDSSDIIKSNDDVLSQTDNQGEKLDNELASAAQTNVLVQDQLPTSSLDAVDVQETPSTDSPVTPPLTDDSAKSQKEVSPPNVQDMKAMSGDSDIKANGDKPTVETKSESVPVPEAKNNACEGVISVENEQNNDNPPEKEAEPTPKQNGKEGVEDAVDENPQDDEEPVEPTENKKKVYDRLFLMQFRFHDTSLEKPSDLPAIEDIIMDRPLPKSSISTNLPSLEGSYNSRSGADFMPGWMGGGSGGHRGGRQASRNSRPTGHQQRGYSGYGHSGSQSGPKVIKKVSIQREPELNKAENAWKSSRHEQPKGSNITEEEQTQEILRSVRAILNKLTPQKFSSLMQQFQQLKIDTEGRLRDVINLIFEKAIDEPNFCEAYANMCRTMSQFRVTTSSSNAQNASQPGAIVEFRKILLTRCQREFEKDRANEDALRNLRKKMEEAKTPEEKQQIKEELEYAETKERRRMLGNIRFIGELFKLNMLTESIMHNCIMSLFKGKDEESLESLCRLLNTIGKDLDHVKGKARMDQYMTQIEKIIREKKTSSRVRFMLKDVIDLRQRNWVQRAVKSQGPKTIEQIHADAKEEKEQQALQVAAAVAAPMKSQSRGGRMGSRGASGHNADEGWTKVGLAQKPTRYDPDKMRLSKFDESNVTLGPSRGKSNWKSGSGGPSATKTGSGNYSNRGNMDNSAPRSSTPTSMMNRFSALGASGGPESMHAQRGPGRVSSQERSKSGSRGSTGSGGSRSSGRDERMHALDHVRRFTSTEGKTQNQRGDNANIAVKPPVNVAEPQPVVDEAAVLKKINSTLKEYLHLVDIKEASECFDELKMPSSSSHLIVTASLEASLEKSTSDRSNIAQLLSHLVKNNKIVPEQYIKGVMNIMDLAVDIELDLPKVWSCLAELVAPIFYTSGSKISFSCLKAISEPLLEVEKAAVFVAEILKILTQHMSVDTAVQYWKESGLGMNHFLKSDDPSVISEFLDRHDLSSFFDANSQITVSKEIPPTGYQTYLLEIKKQLNMNKSDDDFFDWVESKFSKDEMSHSCFIRSLTSAVCQKAIIQGDKQLEVDKGIIQTHSILLKKYIDTAAKELQAVYALQQLFVDLEQPPNVLKLLFDFLYDEDIISEQTFFDWEVAEDPECEGKGVALLSVNPFFTWLREADVESDS